VNLKPFAFWKGEILSLSLVLGLSLVGASPLWAHHPAGFAYVTNGGANSVLELPRFDGQFIVFAS
jgi:hypothetical protein